MECPILGCINFSMAFSTKQYNILNIINLNSSRVISKNNKIYIHYVGDGIKDYYRHIFFNETRVLASVLKKFK